jgi:hypothetical protein
VGCCLHVEFYGCYENMSDGASSAEGKECAGPPQNSCIWDFEFSAVIMDCAHK